MRFTWDESKRRANLRKYGLDFADAGRVFDGPMVLFEDMRVDYREQRMIGIGLLDFLVVLIAPGDRERTSGSRFASRDPRGAGRALKA